MEKSAKELLKNSGEIYNHFIKLQITGALSNQEMDRLAEDLKNINGVLAQSVLQETDKTKRICRDAMGYFEV